MSDKLRSEFESILKLAPSFKEDCASLERDTDGSYLSKTFEAAFQGFLVATARAAVIVSKYSHYFPDDIVKEIRGE